MAKIANNLTELIGGTPLMKLAGYSRKVRIATGGWLPNWSPLTPQAA